MVKILFVCLGNICRSPMAEAIFKHLAYNEGLDSKLYIQSAGTAGYHIGDAPDYRTIQVCTENDIEIHHKGQKLQKEDFLEYDYIIGMDEDNIQDILDRRGTIAGKAEILKMRAFDTINKDGDVPDPYYGSLIQFNEVYVMLSRCAPALLNYIRNKSGV